MSDDRNEDSLRQEDPGATVVRAVSSEDLLQGGAELRIRHEGEYYRLRRTSKGKLILTK